MDNNQVLIAYDPAALEAEAMEVWAKKLKIKSAEFTNEQNSFKKSKLADELISMIDQHIKALRESSIVSNYTGEEREMIEEGITRLEAMLVVLRFSKDALDRLNLFGGQV